MRNATSEHVDEYAETQVLTDKPAVDAKTDDDPASQSLYSEYVQELEQMLKAGSRK
jgi:hypothetical protein